MELTRDKENTLAPEFLRVQTLCILVQYDRKILSIYWAKISLFVYCDSYGTY